MVVYQNFYGQEFNVINISKQLIYMEQVIIVMGKMREKCLVLKDFLQRKRIHI
jgi:hypothetical protein